MWYYERKIKFWMYLDNGKQNPGEFLTSKF